MEVLSPIVRCITEIKTGVLTDDVPGPVLSLSTVDSYRVTGELARGDERLYSFWKQLGWLKPFQEKVT